MSYVYNPGDPVTVLDPAEPNGAAEPISVLDNAIRQVKAYLRDGTEGPAAKIAALGTAVSNPTRVVATHLGGQIVGESDGQVVIAFNQEDLDTNNDFSIVTYKFTAPKDGLYLVITGITLNKVASAAPTGIVHQMDLFIDAISGARTKVARGTDDATTVDLQLTRMFNLSLGQTISVRYSVTVASGTLSVELLTDPRETVFQVTKLHTS